MKDIDIKELANTLEKKRNFSLKEIVVTNDNKKYLSLSKIENGFIDEVGIKKVENILDLLGVEFALRPKGRPKTLEELQEELELAK
jgi:hypothetical protein